MTQEQRNSPHELPEYYCHRGDKMKAEIVADFTLYPIAHLKLIPGQAKVSYSGYPLTDQYYCFSFERKNAPQQAGVFFCGRDVARDFLSLTGSAELPLFNPLRSDTESGGRGGSRAGGGTSAPAVNANANKKLFIDAARLLMSLWDATGKGQTPLAAVLQSAIDDGIDAPPTFQQVLSVNTMLGNTRSTLSGLLAEAKKKYPEVAFRDFDFSPLNAIVARSKYYDKHPPCY